MSKILVTGHRGLLGSACIRRLGTKNEMMTFDGDLLEPYNFRHWVRINRPDAVIHCAAKVGGVKANRDKPVDFLCQNLKIQSTVIEACAFYAIPRLVFIGTSCLFPKDAPLPVSEDSLLTGPFESSVQAYAIAKLAGYAMCKAYHDQCGFAYTTACPSNIYGPGDNYGPSAHVIPALISKLSNSIKTGEPFVVWGDGSAIREFIYADDVADAIGVILEKWYKPDMINVGIGIGTSIKYMVETMMEVCRQRVEIVWDTSQPIGIPSKTFDITKISSLGWKPQVGLHAGLLETWRDFNKGHTRNQ